MLCRAVFKPILAHAAGPIDARDLRVVLEGRGSTTSAL
jgi:hypothetical protein